MLTDKQKAESIILLENRLKLVERLIEQYKNEVLKWVERENELYIKVLKIKAQIKALP